MYRLEVLKEQEVLLDQQFRTVTPCAGCCLDFSGGGGKDDAIKGRIEGMFGQKTAFPGWEVA